MNSYQRRKREIAYLHQRGEELEEIITALQRRLRDGGLSPVIPLIALDVSGDAFITDIASGEFGMRHMLI